MKYLKFKYILTLVLVLTVGIFVLMFFVGGLKARALESGNIPFSLEGYADYSGYNAKGEKFVFYKTQAEKEAILKGIDPSTYEVHDEYVKFHLNPERIVAQNENYTMFFNEHTTAVSVAVNSTCDAPSGKTYEGFNNYEKSQCGIVYDTASSSEQDTAVAQSNLLLRYIGSNGKMSNLAFNTHENSVLYLDKLKDEKERHYAVKYLENGVEVLYDIGDFTIINSFFPKKFDRQMLMDQFIGNTMFFVRVDSRTNAMIYTGDGETWSAECAEYLEENGLATVEPDIPRTNPVLDDDGEPVPAKWRLSNMLALDDEGRELNKLKLQIGVHYNATDFGEPGASPIIANPFAHIYIYNQFLNTTFYYLKSTDKLEDGTEIKYNTDWRGYYSDSSPCFELQNPGPLQLNELYDYWYRKHTDENPNWFYTNLKEATDEYGKKYFKRNYVTYDENPYDDEPGTYFKIGGFHKRDENGKFLYEEDNEPVQEVFTIEEAQIQNEMFGESVEAFPPVFRVAMRFTITDNGLDVAILDDSLIEGKGTNYKEDGKATKYSHHAKFGNMDIMPNFTTNNDFNSEGYIILPDGSGAIMRFNSPKSPLNYQAEFKEFYGRDQTFSHRIAQQTQDNKNYMLNMYGFLDKTKKKGVLAIVDRGASQTAVYADFKRAESQYLGVTNNFAYFRIKYRESEEVRVGTWQTKFTKWSTGRNTTDFVFKYKFLSADEFIDDDGNIQYITLAQKYRNYLVDKYQLKEKDNTDKTVVFLNMLGAFEKREVMLGIPYKKDYSLTTFQQAQEIIQDLQKEGINDFKVSYTAWTKDAMEPEATAKIKASRILGGTADLYQLVQFLDENKINFYPELLVASNKGYDFSFGDIKYTARSVTNLYAHHWPYVLATNVANSTAEPIRMISPRFYHHLATKTLSSYKRFSINGAFLSDIGNVRIGDYRQDIFPERGKDYQVDALDKINGELPNILMSAPFDYSLQFAESAVDVPMVSTLLKGFDYSIPFYQLVISGLIDYAGSPANYNREESKDWYLLKALETGSNLYFALSYEDPKKLLKTDYTMYFESYYANCKNDIIKMKNIIDGTRIHEGRLISHKILQDNVYLVEYSNGVKLIINYNNTTYNDALSGLAVGPTCFAIVEGGE
ncbi:MAG: DUF5696 domain-containing protein [Bacilli bacterium]|nr:DUF5696 domain-containing protein [Bacilli bacterium]MDD4077112.1 DUF5696 domain-containing protein [Bacilli bacterium]MDD4388390.1 DUF5696 domain-containing protein [Bacilli bacterium]